MKAPTIPRIPKKYHNGTPKKMTKEMIKIGKKLLSEGNSERYIANLLKISRHTMKMYCKKGFREWYYENYKKIQRGSKETNNKNARRRYQLAKSLYPDKISDYHKESYKWRKLKYGKESLAEIQRKYRKEQEIDSL